MAFANISLGVVADIDHEGFNQFRGVFAYLLMTFHRCNGMSTRH
jgi:hypothetical protein